MNRLIFLFCAMLLFPVCSLRAQCITTGSTSFSILCTKTKGNVTLDSIKGGTRPYTFSIDGVSNGNDSVFSDVELGSHTVTITDSGNACQVSITISVVKGECPPLSPPPVVSPNGDGTNDKWYILGLNNYPDSEVWIFDRWGQRIYHTKEYSNQDPWEGKYLGKILPTASYYYIINTHYEDPSGEEIIYKGVVSVVK